MLMINYLDTKVLECKTEYHGTSFILKSEKLDGKINYKIPLIIYSIKKGDKIEFQDIHFNNPKYAHLGSNFSEKEITHDNYKKALVYCGGILKDFFKGREIIIELEANHMKTLTGESKAKQLEIELNSYKERNIALEKEIYALKNKANENGNKKN